MGRFTPAVLGLVLATSAVFVAGLLIPDGHMRLVIAGGFWFPANPAFSLWQPLTYLFLHGGFSHLLLNMLALVSFGVVLERQWGLRRFLTFYFLCGIGAGLVQVAINAYQYEHLWNQLVAAGFEPATLKQVISAGEGQVPADPGLKAMLVHLYEIYATPMIGASGAIYGVLVAFGLMYPNAKLAMIFFPVPIAAKFFIPLLLGLDLFSGVTGFSIFGGGVAHFAHVGGAVIGFLLMLLWRRRGQTFHVPESGR